MEGDREILPDDVFYEEILVRLPVKSLILCKSVSQTCLRRIESNYFAEIHRRRHRIHNYSDSILVYSPFIHSSDPITKSSSLLPSPFPPPDSVRSTVAPLNLMLPAEATRIQWPNVESGKVQVSVLGPLKPTGVYCVVAKIQHGRRFPLTKITLCNPSMKSYKLVPPYPPEEFARISDLAGEYCVQVGYGFGVAADGDYKVVVVFTWNHEGWGRDFASFVYSWKKGEWTKIVDSTSDMVSGLHFGGEPSYCNPGIYERETELCPQVFLNGCWHWTARFRDGRTVLLSFDVDNEVFKFFRIPPTDEGREAVKIVTTLNDHLALIHNYQGSCKDVAIRVWMMMEYGDEESWTSVWTVGRHWIAIETLVGISYSLREDKDGDEDGNGNGNGGIRIHKLFYKDHYDDLHFCDESGVTRVRRGFDTSSCIFWNNIGISAYSETLDRL